MENCSPPNHGTKVPYDPGWNDPPKSSYSTQQTTPNRPRNFLNKRVAFPVMGAAAVTNPMPATSINCVPPMPPIFTPTPTMLVPKPPEAEFEQNNDSENTMKEVTEILLQFLESSHELGSKANDIRKRISVMEEMWLSGKLNKNIHLQMKHLACALRDNQPSKADDIHRALMVDHVSAVGTWMPGVKQLIHHCIARSELLAIDKEEQ